VIGTVEQCTERLQQLVDAGVHEFNNYLMFEERERNLQDFGSRIIPRFSTAHV
jgi:hypothetical protein